MNLWFCIGRHLMNYELHSHQPWITLLFSKTGTKCSLWALSKGLLEIEIVSRWKTKAISTSTLLIILDYFLDDWFELWLLRLVLEQRKSYEEVKGMNWTQHGVWLKWIWTHTSSKNLGLSLKQEALSVFHESASCSHALLNVVLSDRLTIIMYY
jgi:hypothetical protein